MTLNDFFQRVYRPLRLLGKSQRTVTLYEYSLRLFADTIGRAPTLDDFSDMVVAGHLQSLIDRGMSRNSVRKERNQILAMWRLAARKRLVEQFPDVPQVDVPRKVPAAWTMEELWRLKISCNFVPGEYCGVKANKWWVALHFVLWTTAERKSAVMAAKWRDITDDRIVFPAENRKGSKTPNVCQLPDYAMEALAAIRQPERDLLFPFPFSETHLYHMYSKILKRAELDSGPNSKFHRMRRSHATHLKIAGGDPTTSLGHANPATTAGYIDPRLIPDETCRKLPRLG